MSHIATLSVMVKVDFDEEAKVWVAISDDVPGLVAEHESLDELSNIIVELVPILLLENGMLSGLLPNQELEIPIHIAANAVTRRNALVAA